MRQTAVWKVSGEGWPPILSLPFHLGLSENRRQGKMFLHSLEGCSWVVGGRDERSPQGRPFVAGRAGITSLFSCCHVTISFFFLTFYFILEYSWLTLWYAGGTAYPPAIHIYVCVGLSHTYTRIRSPPNSLPSRLPRNTEPSSLCYFVDPCWLSILNIAVCTCIWWFLYKDPW